MTNKHLISIVFFLFIGFAGNSLTIVQQPIKGKYTEHYPDKTLRVKGHYVKGNKDGFWFYYGQNKIIEKKELYKKGNLKRVYIYNVKGQLSEIIDEKGNITTKPTCGC